jgi:hypothetical protein
MLYEVRTYTLHPGNVAEFEERFAKRLPLRVKHSKLGAFWHTEFGNRTHSLTVHDGPRVAVVGPGSGMEGLARIHLSAAENVATRMPASSG